MDEFMIDCLAGKLTTIDAVTGYLSKLELGLATARTALEFYAAASNYMTPPVSADPSDGRHEASVTYDEGEIARKALAAL